MKQSRSEMIQLRGNSVHIRRWGPETAPVLFMLHGWMDMSATFQFMVDAFEQEWQIIAPDWAGFGCTPARHKGANHLTEYLCDLHALLDHYSPLQPVKIVAHSMGANVVNLFAGSFPERVSHFVNIEALGPMPGLDFLKPAARIRAWMERGGNPPPPKKYQDVEQFAARLRSANGLLSLEQAMYLAEEFTEPSLDGGRVLQTDEGARIITPFFASKEVFEDCWENITAKVLFFRGGLSFMTDAFDTVPGELQRRYALISNFKEILIDEAGHNLQHDFPERLASESEQFFSC